MNECSRRFLACIHSFNKNVSHTYSVSGTALSAENTAESLTYKNCLPQRSDILVGEEDSEHDEYSNADSLSSSD